MRMLFEGCDSVEGEFVVCSYLDRGARNDHGGQGFVSAEEVFGDGVGDGDKVRFEVVGVADDERGGNNVGEGFGGKVASERPLGLVKVAHQIVVIGFGAGENGSLTSVVFVVG